MKSFHMKLKGGYLLNIVFLMLFSLSFVMMGCDDDDDDSAAPAGTIVTLVQENDDLSTLEAALTKFPDLVTTLSSTTAEYTVFAPNNAAFNALLSAIGQSNLNDIPEDVLRGVLEYHVIAAQKILSAQLTAGPATTANGEDITVTTAGGIKLNSSVSVSTADVNATNGVVHVIDGVLVPPSIAQFVNTVVEPAYFNKNFSTLIAAVKGASPAVLQTLLNDSKKTLFAPTNEAFTAAGITSLPATASLDAILTYHVIGAEVKSSDIAAGSSSAETLTGRIYLSKTSEGVYINGKTKVTQADIVQDNGVVHVIDYTLMPATSTIADIAIASSTSASAEFTQLVAALSKVPDLLAAADNSSANLTVFAPTDEAFEALYTALGVNDIDELVDNIGADGLANVLKHHIVGTRVFSTDLTSGAVPTLNENLTVDLTANPPTIKASGGETGANLQISLLNIHATNGVIHVIDKVLIPANL
jgi:transforming growth factor-beta-induced protein